MTPQVVELQSGDILFKEGDASGVLYYVKEGCLMVFQQRGDLEVPLQILKEGEFIGTVSFFFDAKRSASVRAITPVTLDAYSYIDSKKYLSAIPSWIFAVIKDVITRLKRMDQSLMLMRQTEKVLQRKLPNRFTYAAMLCRLLKMGIESRAGGEVLQVDYNIQDFPEKAAKIFLVEPDILNPIFFEIVKSRFLDAEQDRDRGITLRTPQLSHLDLLASIFEEKSKARQQGGIFTSLAPWYRGIQEVMKKKDHILEPEKTFLANLETLIESRIDSVFLELIISQGVLIKESLAGNSMIRVDLEILEHVLDCEEIVTTVQKLALPSPDAYTSI